MTIELVLIILVALAFDFSNGFHDAANSISTIVSTKVLTPTKAVIWAAFFNFIAFLVFEPHVSSSIARGISPAAINQTVILATLIGAISWNLITWWFGLPSSSSHALLGGFAGAALANIPRFNIINMQVFGKTFLFIFLAPLLGFAIAYVLMFLLKFVMKYFKDNENIFKKGQLLSAAFYSLAHGGNDAQKTMGIITALLVSAHLQRRGSHPLLWVVLSCHAAMALGTLCGGWRIVKTMGEKITELKPVSGCAAETAGAISISLATSFGVPVSTTHTITGSIVGAGVSSNSTKGISWFTTSKILFAWLLTIPASGLIAALTYILLR